MTSSIRVQNLSLAIPTFVQRERKTTSWLSTLFSAATARPVRQFRTLLNDVSFELAEGDRLGLIGANGAGKTTLLRVLTGAYAPTQGTLSVTGTRQALLNIGLGFSKEATLMENIYLRGTAMGMPTKELRRLSQSMLEFSGLQNKAQDRLYTLSSGQRARLGFAIATAIKRDIVLMDEWLGAGDAAFIERAKQRMSDRVDGSKIVVLASHNASIVEQICNKGMVLDQGRVCFFGDVKSALAAYAQQVKEAKAAKKQAELKALEEAGVGKDTLTTTSSGGTTGSSGTDDSSQSARRPAKRGD